MSVDFDPVRVGREPRRVDPLAIGMVVVVIALTIAIVKPWDGDARVPGPSSEAITRSAGPSVAPIASATLAPKPGPVDPPVARPPRRLDLARVNLRAHDEWGVRVLLLDRRLPLRNGYPPYVDRWSPATGNGKGAWTAVIESDPRSIDVLGVTVPRDDFPIAVRIWRTHLDDRLEWIDAAPADPGNPDGSLLFIRPGVGDEPVAAWEPGRYRIDVLVARGIRRIVIDLPGPFTAVPPPQDWTFARQGIVASALSEPPAVTSGMFAFVDGTAVPLRATTSRPLDEAEAWRDLAGIGDDVVASAFLPRTSALGIMFPSGTRIEAATLRRLSPETPFEPPPRTRGNSDRRGRSPFVLFEVPDGGVFAPGVYAISATWTIDGSTHEDTWHAELMPGRS